MIAVCATGLVFSMTLLTAGASEGLHFQDRHVVESFYGDVWYVAAGSSGPFTTSTPVDQSVAAEVAARPGISRATPVLLFRATIDDGRRDVNLIGVAPGDLGEAKVSSGRPPNASGDVAVDTALNLAVGSTVNVGGIDMHVVGTVPDASYYFGTPTVYMTLADMQTQFFSSVPVATAIVAQGKTDVEVPGMRAFSVDQVLSDMARPSKRGDDTIRFINFLLWIVAVGVIGAIVYLSALERVRDFAVMKATGSSGGSLMVGLAMQAVILSATSALLASGLATLLAPTFPFTVRIQTQAYLVMIAVAVVIGIAASAAGLRRLLKIDPALAFGGS